MLLTLGWELWPCHGWQQIASKEKHKGENWTDGIMKTAYTELLVPKQDQATGR